MWLSFDNIFLLRTDQDGLTPCHAVALGGKLAWRFRKSTDNIKPLDDICLCAEEVVSLLPHNILTAQCQRRCLEYLVQFGGDLEMCSYQQQETTMDIAKRRGKASVVDMIEEYCKRLHS